MSIISTMRKQTAVYWAETGTDQFGAPTYAAATEVSCRWETGSVEFLNPKSGTPEAARSTVYVDRVMNIGDVLFLGELADVTYVNDAKANDGAWEIRSFEKLPNLKNTETLYTAYL